MYAILTRIFALTALLAAATSAGPGGARAQERQLEVTPASGSCDAAIEVRGAGFPPGTVVEISILRPHSEGPYAQLAETTADETGSFAADLTLGPLGCEVAARDDGFDDPGEPKELHIWAYSPAAEVGRTVPYTYTSTTPEDGTATPAITREPTPPKATPPSGASATATPPNSTGGDSDNTTAIVAVTVVVAGALAVLGGALVLWRRRGQL